MEGKHFGYSGDYLDRFIQSRDSPVVNKFQKKYWKTKQTLIKVTGKKEDEHVVASDADLDAKLEVFHSIQRTCMELLKVIELYQRRICYLSQEENELGRFLRSQGSQDKSRAGKIMQATGKALCFSSQQRLALRKPLCRLYQEIETFRYRAISDTWLTVNRMEQTRTEYRGALLWMKDVSQELDPDTHKQMEKFRKVQTQVRTTKTSFDKLKNDVCQKVDMLGASRCNLLSHILTIYQTTLLHFWGKTSHTMAAIHESFKGCQHNELSTLQVSQDSTEKLDKKMGNKTMEAETEEKIKDETTDDQLISLGHEDKNEKIREELDGEDSLALLNEILGGLFVEEGDFSQEWTKGFGKTEASAASAGSAETQQQQENPFFLPSQLLDNSLNKFSLSDWTGRSPQPVTCGAECSPGAERNPPKPAVKETDGPSKDLSAWFNLFADLDPLSNPDAIGESNGEHELHTA
ncbi:islet cell autoantigen 1 isoform X1 [Girardinichthys multiradiatus]|uniref:islet cell autoantigen 1 isoform X1 n=2 Tax=Girardinichthys multiradiatus TaxID=208333 RepID=UPI001FAC22AD|nr:islet cell autoantigen 1 isoform X1 [Girardinichthys multiradiatus]XP_047216201.1 islet cell autoantigen 1 isoform X1 [Girardinichthys multiradiatus]